MAGVAAIDAVVAPFTALEVGSSQVGIDSEFMDKVRLPAHLQGGVPMEDFVELMDRAGVERSILLALRAGDRRVPHSFAIPYDRVAGYCARFPGRLHALAGVDVSAGAAGLRELEQAIAQLGFVGAHLYPQWFGLPPDDRIYYPLYAKCCELDVPLMMQVGHCLDDSRDRIPPSVGFPIALDRVAIDFPELRVVGTHIGWPWTQEMIAVCYKHANVYVAGSGHAPRHWPPAFVHFANSWGQDKCLFGTDWPVISPDRAIREIGELGLRPEAERKLLRDNALRVFRLPA